MKKLLLMAFALLTLGSGVAVAQDGTFNFAWAICRIATSTGTANDRSGACDGSDAALALIATFQPTTTAVQFGGSTVEFSIDFGGTSVPDAWNIQGCNIGGLANASVAALTNCGNPFTGSTQAGGAFTEAVDATRVRYGADWGRTSATAPTIDLSTVTGNVNGFVAQKINFAADIAGTCGGCNAPACLVLNKVIWGSQASGLKTAIAPLNRDFVSWFGGSPNCPGATPTKSATWGQVKALYR